MHSNNQLETAVITYHHTVGENGLGLYRPCHHYQIIQEMLYQQWYIVGWTAQPIWHWLRGRKQRHVWWRTNKYNICSVTRVMMMNFGVCNEYCWFMCILYAGLTPGGLIGPKNRCIYTRVQLIYEYIQ